MRRAAAFIIVCIFMIIPAASAAGEIFLERKAEHSSPVTFDSGSWEVQTAATLVVRSTNTAGPWDGSESNPFRTIKMATDNATNGDLIRVYTGLYLETVTLDNTVRLIGNGSSFSRIIAPVSGTTDVIKVNADGCDISGFEINRSGSGADHAGVHISSNNNNVSHCSIENNANGVIIDSAFTNNVIFGCGIDRSDFKGVYLKNNCDNNYILLCNTTHGEYGIYTSEFGNGSWFDRNNCSANDMYGIRVGGGDYKIRSNKCRRNEIGIYVLNSDNNEIGTNWCLKNKQYGMYLENSKTNSVFKNRLHYSSVHGLLLTKRSDTNIIENNSAFVSGDCGAFLVDSRTNLFKYNSLAYSTNWGVRVNDSLCDANRFLMNNFVSNNGTGGSQAFDDGTSSLWDNGTHGNFYNDWVSPDADANGIVDLPYHIAGPQSYSDGYPLTYFYGGPYFNMTNVETAYEDQEYYVVYSAQDNNTFWGTLKWGMTTNASFLTLTPVRELKGTPTNADVGKWWVRMTATDGVLTAVSNFTLTVENTNDPPVITTLGQEVWPEDKLYTVIFNATDPDPTGDTLNWSVNTSAPFLSMDSATGNLSGMPLNEHVGFWPVSVKVDDGGGGTAYSNYTLNILNTNDQPFLNSTIPPVEFDEDTTDESLFLEDYFIDEDEADAFLYRYEGNSQIAVNILANSTVRFTPAQDWSGSEEITFFASDSIDEINTTVNVTVLAVNDAPMDPVINLLEVKYFQNRSQMVRGNCTDPDLPYGDVLTYEWYSDIAGYIGEGREINLSLKAGKHYLSLNITDSGGLVTSSVLDLMIHPEPVVKPPTPFISIGEPANNTRFDPGEEITVSGTSFGFVNGTGLLVELRSQDRSDLYFEITTKVDVNGSWSVLVTLPLENQTVLVLSASIGSFRTEVTIKTLGEVVVIPDDDDIEPDPTDTDGDGLSDTWETNYFGDLDQGPDDDFDNDNFTNLQEYNNGTDPSDPQDYPGKIDPVDDDVVGDDDSGISPLMIGIGVVAAVLVILVIVVIVVVLMRRKPEEAPVEQKRELTAEEKAEMAAGLAQIEEMAGMVEMPGSDPASASGPPGMEPGADDPLADEGAPLVEEESPLVDEGSPVEEESEEDLFKFDDDDDAGSGGPPAAMDQGPPDAGAESPEPGTRQDGGSGGGEEGDESLEDLFDI